MAEKEEKMVFWPSEDTGYCFFLRNGDLWCTPMLIDGNPETAEECWCPVDELIVPFPANVVKEANNFLRRSADESK